jgi:hypothetical protein
VRIAPSNRLIVYAWSSTAEVVVKSENGGETWFALDIPALAGAGITALGVHQDNANLVLIGTDAGEIWQSENGGEDWVEQMQIQGLTIKANATITDIETAGGGVWFASVNESAASNRVYINYEDGAGGAWEYYNPIDGTEYDTTDPILAIAVSDPNRCVAVGGDGIDSAMVALLS